MDDDERECLEIKLAQFALADAKGDLVAQYNQKYQAAKKHGGESGITDEEFEAKIADMRQKFNKKG